MDSSKRNKSLHQNPASARKSSAKRNSFGDSNDFPIRHLTKSEYMKVRNIPLLEPDLKKYEDLNPSTGMCQPTTNPKKFMKNEYNLITFNMLKYYHKGKVVQRKIQRRKDIKTKMIFTMDNRQIETT